MKQNWILLDMHMHSNYSKYKDNSRVKEMDAKSFIDVMLKNKISLFSITDHNRFNSKLYDEIDKYIKDNKLNLKIINGVECDIKVNIEDGTEDIVHMCLYFEDRINRANLEDSLENLYFDSGKLKKVDFSELLNVIFDLKAKFIIIPHGNKDRGLFNKNLIKKLSLGEREEFHKYAMYKIFNAYDINPSFYDKNSDKYWASNFFEKSREYNNLMPTDDEEKIKIVESEISKKFNQENYILDSDIQKIYDYLIKYGSYFAYFSFSDWHNNEPYEPNCNNFIFGSLDNAFESFEMATLDPVSRIITTTPDKYEIEINPSILNKIEFEINGKRNIIELSPGLNTIVGKRGSGKSLLISVIRNLHDKNDDDGAYKAYKKLNISHIVGYDRKNVEISPGSLSSVFFLKQEEIKEIFENPDLVQNKITSFFPEVRKLNLADISKIVNIGKKIKPIDKNYKSITSNILSFKKDDNYMYSESELLSSYKVIDKFEKVEYLLEELLNDLNDIGFTNISMVNIKKSFQVEKSKYEKMFELYNNIIDFKNLLIKDINKKRTEKDITNKQNLNSIKEAVGKIADNFKIQLNYLKIKKIIKDFKIDNPPVAVIRKNNYLFITYYEIPKDISKELENMILSSLNRGVNFGDIEKYVMNNNSKELKKGFTTIVDNLNDFEKNDIFVAKKEFYEINNQSYDYINKIKDYEDIKKLVKDGYIIDLSSGSLGMKSVAYLNILFDLEEAILVLDQPEDNIDNDYISNYLVPNIKKYKKNKQLIFVTHNPSVAVYGDAFNYIYATNNDGNINYKNYYIEKYSDKNYLIKILEGGKPSFSNRNQKFGNVIGNDYYEDN